MRKAAPLGRATSGMTVVELLMASAVTSVLTAAMFVGSITLQKSFRASQHYAQSQSSQLRLLDYVSLDLRRALTVQVPQRDRIELTIPNFYNADGSVRDPEIARGSDGWMGIKYGAAPVNVAYYVERAADGVSGSLVREEAGVKTTIATDVRDFLPDFERSTDLADKSEQVFKVSVTFAPKFRWDGDGSSVRNGTRISTRVLLRNKKNR
jgi:hypothetical protein